MVQNLILLTRSCGTGFITQCSCVFSFPPDHAGLVEMFCTTVVPVSKGDLGGASP